MNKPNVSNAIAAIESDKSEPDDRLLYLCPNACLWD